MKSLFFREDIQGLRGLAIFFVLIFHFFPSFLPKGFLGVDLFFVISGYLITKIFFKKKENLFFDFFYKRLHRIAPSIIFTIILSIIFSLILFLPNDLNNFWNSILSTLLLVPNFYFLFTGGYFGGINELKPLLHFWSLGIEVQFYFFFPIILLLIKKIKKLYFILLLIFFASLIAHYSLSINDLNKYSFFLLPLRFWEFIAGSIIFFVPRIKLNYFLQYIIYVVSILSIFLIIFAKSHLLNDFIRQFLICFYASLIIYLGGGIYKYDYFLKNFFFKFLGKISYSLYLLHWPILVFAKYYLVREIFFYESILLLLLSIFLSFLFWKFVENKFRYKVSLNQSFKFLTILYLIIVFICFVSKINKNFPERFQKEIAVFSNSLDSNYRCNIQDYLNFFDNRKCKIIENPKNLNIDVVLLGNSHAQMYGYGFEKFLKEKKLNGLIIPLNSCLPTISVNITKECISLAKKNLDTVLNIKNLKHVFVGLDWNHNFLKNIRDDNISNENSIALSKSLFELLSFFTHRNIATTLIGPISVPAYEFVSIEARNLYFNHKRKISSFTQSKKEFENKYSLLFKYFVDKKVIKFVKPHEIQCASGNCLFAISNESLFSDSTHLSKFGSLLMYKIFYYN